MLLKLGATVALGVVMLTMRKVTSVQHRFWQADVGIQSLTVEPANGELRARVVIYSGMDDPSRGVRVEVLLPLGTSVLRMPPGCRVGADTGVGDQVRGRISCELGTLRVRERRELDLGITVPAPGVVKSVAAFVSSESPDPRPGDNYLVKLVP